MTALANVRKRFARVNALYRATASTRDILDALDALDSGIATLEVIAARPMSSPELDDRPAPSPPLGQWVEYGEERWYRPDGTDYPPCVYRRDRGYVWMVGEANAGTSRAGVEQTLTDAIRAADRATQSAPAAVTPAGGNTPPTIAPSAPPALAIVGGDPLICECSHALAFHYASPRVDGLACDSRKCACPGFKKRLA